MALIWVKLPTLMAVDCTKVPPPFWYQRVRFCKSVGSSALPTLLFRFMVSRISAPVAATLSWKTKLVMLFR